MSQYQYSVKIHHNLLGIPSKADRTISYPTKPENNVSWKRIAQWVKFRQTQVVYQHQNSLMYQHHSNTYCMWVQIWKSYDAMNVTKYIIYNLKITDPKHYAKSNSTKRWYDENRLETRKTLKKTTACRDLWSRFKMILRELDNHSKQAFLPSLNNLNLVPVEHCYIETLLANNFLDLFFYSLALWNPHAKRQLHHLHSETHNSNDLALPKSI